LCRDNSLSASGVFAVPPHPRLPRDRGSRTLKPLRAPDFRCSPSVIHDVVLK